jgi:hypothetical protein
MAFDGVLGRPASSRGTLRPIAQFSAQPRLSAPAAARLGPRAFGTPSRPASLQLRMLTDSTATFQWRPRLNGRAADLIDPTLALVCTRCQRHGRCSVARHMAKHGDARLTDLRTFLTADCPQRARKSIAAQCQAMFDPLPETRREKPTW